MTEHPKSLGILQDPLLMLLALMLLGSLAFILPSGPDSQGPPIDPPAIRHLEKEVAALEKTYLDWIDKQGRSQGHGEAPPSDNPLIDQLQDVNARIQRLSGLLHHAKSEVDEHEQRLTQQTDASGEALQDEIIVTQEVVHGLKQRRQELQDFVNTRRGLPIYSHEGSKGRTAVLAEATESRLYIVNEANYTRDEYRSAYCNRLVVRERRRTAWGDDHSDLNGGSSRWHRELSGLDPNEYYVLVWVREDGFRAFLKARLIAQRLKFPVGWYPLDDDPIGYCSDRGKARGNTKTPEVTGGVH